jgi:hypothetical protein
VERHPLVTGDLPFNAFAARRHFDVDRVWLHSLDTQIRGLRRTWTLLVPGDVVFVPQRGLLGQRLEAGQSHRILGDLPDDVAREFDVHVRCGGRPVQGAVVAIRFLE